MTLIDALSDCEYARKIPGSADSSRVALDEASKIPDSWAVVAFSRGRSRYSVLGGGFSPGRCGF